MQKPHSRPHSRPYSRPPHDNEHDDGCDYKDDDFEDPETTEPKQNDDLKGG